MSLIVGTEDWDDCERRQLWLSGTLCGGGTVATAWRIAAYFPRSTRLTGFASEDQPRNQLSGRRTTRHSARRCVKLHVCRERPRATTTTNCSASPNANVTSGGKSHNAGQWAETRTIIAKTASTIDSATSSQATKLAA